MGLGFTQECSNQAHALPLFSAGPLHGLHDGGGGGDHHVGTGAVYWGWMGVFKKRYHFLYKCRTSFHLHRL